MLRWPRFGNEIVFETSVVDILFEFKPGSQYCHFGNPWKS